MNCMKCGRDVGDRQVFCDDCLQDMRNYPVDPSTPVQIPRRSDPAPGKKTSPRKRQLSPEELLHQRSRLIRGLLLTVLALILALSLCITALVMLMLRQNGDKTPIGRNYSTVNTTTEP